MKVVYNPGPGHFAFSDEALNLLNKKRTKNGYLPLQAFDDVETLDRHDQLLVEVVEELEYDVNRNHWNCDIKIADISVDYIDVYEIKGNGSRESIICDPDKLYLSMVKNLTIDNISELEYKPLLSKIIHILNTRTLELI